MGGGCSGGTISIEAFGRRSVVEWVVESLTEKFGGRHGDNGAVVVRVGTTAVSVLETGNPTTQLQDVPLTPSTTA